jgi:hypothetical protein
VVVGLLRCTVRLMPVVRSPNIQLRKLPASEHPLTGELRDHTIPVPSGSVSVSVTFLAVTTPVFLTVIVNPIGLPALTEGLSATLLIKRLVHWTKIKAVASAKPSFVVVTLAWLLINPHRPLVGDVIWTRLLAPAARSPKLQVSMPLLIIQPGSDPGSITQFIPPPAGSTSVTVTPVAVISPVLVTMIVNPIVSLTLTAPASAVLVIMTPAPCTMIHLGGALLCSREAVRAFW